MLSALLALSLKKFFFLSYFSFYVSAEKGVWKQHLYSYNTEAATSVCLSCDQQGWGIPSSMLYVVVFKW